MIKNRRTVGGYGASSKAAVLSRSASLGALALAVQTGVTYAQAQASTQTQLPEVVVTAQKRSTNLESTPVSITALTGAQLQRAGINDITTALLSAPSVAFVSAGPGKTVYNIRGLSSNGGAAPTVGFYLDETPISSPVDSTNGKVAIDPTLYDLAEVEVLRGPQGTLYGAGSMGGTIKLETHQPDPRRFDASAEAIGSDTDHGGANGAFNGMVNLPLIADKLALRIVATEKDDDGYIDRIVVPGFPQPTIQADGSLSRGDVTDLPVSKTNKNVNTEDTQALRVAVKYQATDQLAITGSAFLQYTHQDGSPLYDNPPGTLAHYQPADVAEPFEDRFGIYNLLASYDVGPVRLLSSTSYTRRYTSQVEDTTEEYNSPLVFGTDAYIPASIQETHPSSQLSEEFRITSRTKGPFQWLGGVFYSYSKDSYKDTSTVPQYESIFGTSNAFQYDEPDVTKQYAVFGEASYQILKNVQATAGLRVFSYTNAFNLNQTGLFVSDPSLETGSGKVSASGVTPKFSVSWTPTDKALVYATAAKGFRPGAENLPVPIGNEFASCSAGLQALGFDGEPGAYKADSVWSYELGQKTRWMNNRLIVNSSAFYIDWSQVQQEVFLACGFHITTNQGNAVSKGGETEINYLISDNLRFNGGFGYTDATLQSNTAGGVKGQQLQDVPKWTANAALEYTHPVTDRIGFIGRATFEYVGESHDRGEKPAYNLVGLRTGLTFDKISAFLFADNVFDSRPIVAFSNALGVNIPDVDRLTTLRPRTIGLDLQYHY